MATEGPNGPQLKKEIPLAESMICRRATSTDRARIYDVVTSSFNQFITDEELKQMFEEVDGVPRTKVYLALKENSEDPDDPIGLVVFRLKEFDHQRLQDEIDFQLLFNPRRKILTDHPGVLTGDAELFLIGVNDKPELRGIGIATKLLEYGATELRSDFGKKGIEDPVFTGLFRTNNWHSMVTATKVLGLVYGTTQQVVPEELTSKFFSRNYDRLDERLKDLPKAARLALKANIRREKLFVGSDEDNLEGTNNIIVDISPGDLNPKNIWKPGNTQLRQPFLLPMVQGSQKELTDSPELAVLKSVMANGHVPRNGNMVIGKILHGKEELTQLDLPVRQNLAYFYLTPNWKFKNS